MIKHFLLTIIAAGLVGGFVAVSVPSYGLKADRTVVIPEEVATQKAIAQVSHAVVSVVSHGLEFDPLSGIIRETSGVGSGFIVSSDGQVVTSAHVVENPNVKYTVVLGDQRQFEVKAIKRNLENDIALLTIAAVNLPTVTLGNSDTVIVGQRVIAIGNAFGNLEGSVTSGIVSAKNRSIPFPDQFRLSKTAAVQNVIQIDAALNPGNSGGPLVNLNGEVIGVNFAIRSDAENVGFAVPIDTVRKLLRQKIVISTTD